MSSQVYPHSPAPAIKHTALLTLLTLLTLIISSPLISVKSARAFDVSGDLKLFHQMSGAPRGADQFDGGLFGGLEGSSGGALTSRLKLKQSWGALSLEAHGLLSALGSGANAGPFSLSPNVALVDEALPLSYQIIDDGSAQALLRVDRLLLTYEWGSTRARIGRQAISFGQGRVFTPLDRVSPFSPAAVDREYKPGVDAARLEGYWGVAGEWTIVAAQRGDWTLERSVFAARARDSFWGWDLSLTGLWVEGDRTLGLSLAGALGPVSLYGDVALTWRAESGRLAESDALRGVDERFTRATLGGSWPWSSGGGGSVQVEVAWLGDGAEDATQYLNSSIDPRVALGERWLLGRAYASLALAQALTPLLNASLTLISNLQDPSALVGPALSWSISDEANAIIGGYLGVGEGLARSGIPTPPGIPAIPTPQSELGALSWVSFVMLSAHY